MLWLLDILNIKRHDYGVYGQVWKLCLKGSFQKDYNLVMKSQNFENLGWNYYCIGKKKHSWFYKYWSAYNKKASFSLYINNFNPDF